jgi:hypothetical protein
MNLSLVATVNQWVVWEHQQDEELAFVRNEERRMV